MNDVLEAHHIALSQSGGLKGVRDIALIESAIGRPYSGHHRKIERKAAALLESLSKNHGFVDGNKRTALLVTILFLDRTGYRLVATKGDIDREFEDLILKVVTGRTNFDEAVDWFRRRIRRI